MPIHVNLRQLQDQSLELQGALPVEELDLGAGDELVHLREPVEYRLRATMLDEALLIEGSLAMPVHCECARCLRPVESRVDLPHWAIHIALTGEDRAPVVNDCVDLTPFIREDILLGLPQHPLCEAGCPGPPQLKRSVVGSQSGSSETAKKVSAWDELDKLKL
jgi:uncharacterized protein